MRLMPASPAAALKLSKRRVTPGIASEVDSNVILSLPKNEASAAAAAPLKVLWPEVYDGKGGVLSSDSQFGSAASDSFFNAPAARIAVTGRQKSILNLQSQHAMAASAKATLSMASSRALSMVCSFRAEATL